MNNEIQLYALHTDFTFSLQLFRYKYNGKAVISPRLYITTCIHCIRYDYANNVHTQMYVILHVSLSSLTPNGTIIVSTYKFYLRKCNFLKCLLVDCWGRDALTPRFNLARRGNLASRYLFRVGETIECVARKMGVQRVATSLKQREGKP